MTEEVLHLHINNQQCKQAAFASKVLNALAQNNCPKTFVRKNNVAGAIIELLYRYNPIEAITFAYEFEFTYVQYVVFSIILTIDGVDLVEYSGDGTDSIEDILQFFATTINDLDGDFIATIIDGKLYVYSHSEDYDGNTDVEVDVDSRVIGTVFTVTSTNITSDSSIIGDAENCLTSEELCHIICWVNKYVDADCGCN